MANSSSQNRRADYRLDLTLPISIAYVDPRTKRRMNVSAHTRNISATGISIYTEKPLPESLHFIVRFRDHDLMVAPQAQVLREERPDNGLFIYHCKFENLTDETESKIRAFVFRREAMIRMKDKEG